MSVTEEEQMSFERIVTIKRTIWVAQCECGERSERAEAIGEDE